MNINYKKVFCVIAVCSFLFSMNVSALTLTKETTTEEQKSFQELAEEKSIGSSYEPGDLDPLVDLAVTVTIKEIRAFDKTDLIGKPDLYVKIFVNGEMAKSPTWRNQKYVTEEWSCTFDVPDEEENVSVKIQLWEDNLVIDRICDLSQNNELFRSCYDIDLIYNLRTGHWYGEDFIYPEGSWSDFSGYGRLNGCDDNSIYEKRDRDCEILFDITQTDFDGDGIPYWTEENVFGTDPTFDNRGWDNDSDGVPIEWEFKWGQYIWQDWHHGGIEFFWFYDPFVWEDHRHLDPDQDGLDNVEEYLTSEWGSDPFRKDVFVELDQMEEGPDGEAASMLPDGSKDLIIDAFNRQNIVLHIDDGSMGGGEMIPFDSFTPREELYDIYWNYFLHGDSDNWRRGVFHYGIVVYDANYSGYVFDTGVDDYAGAFQISSSRVNKKAVIPTQKRKDVSYAGVYMHELGHTLDIYIPGGHDQNSQSLWQINFWKWRTYVSCMNYGYTYLLVDYSDGSRGKNDHDDWHTLDLPYFQEWID